MVPRIKWVQPCEEFVLKVAFNNGVVKIYDMKSKLDEPRFSALKDKGIFRAVQVDGGGYGVSWNDEIDLSENELWMNGKELN
ncbi:DUF2442 domain-containing protein [Sporolituus thermophilus]|uniref:DUF2442 domain-containing protein n=1 Tax=Sporolituus thermophilus DSM 23256 TaxID=1123285 RepID=A0A1G7MLQ4_9FIRM|nr:DUF2442 domain-containing protein [Sporolituus thermophilus]SDF62010.1 Protein of unknown function [Sporolituus thermophilus DSM 23256]